MTNQEKMNILIGIYDALFQSKQANSDITQVVITTNMGKFPGRWFVNQTLRGFDVDISTEIKMVQIRCIEQNPNKLDNNGNLKKHANLAQQGHKIMWVIDRKGSWLGHMQDGIWIPANDPATKPSIAGTQYTKLGSQPVEDAAYAHINKDFSDPNFHGIPGTSGTPMANLPIEAAMPQSLPEISNDVDIPEYVLQSISAMDEPPDWDDHG